MNVFVEMKNLIKILLIIAFIGLLTGCGDLRWNWSDNRKRIKPKLSSDVPIDPNRVNEIILDLYKKWRLKEYEKEYLNNGKNLNR